jgi:hypothetical protein
VCRKLFGRARKNKEKKEEVTGASKLKRLIN